MYLLELVYGISYFEREDEIRYSNERGNRDIAYC
jgi:hypothetical protein